MQHAYATSHGVASIGADAALINLTGSATIRCHIYDVLFGSDGTPADQAAEIEINRSTSVGTGGTALNENPLDPLTDTANGAAVGGTFTTDPADTANSYLLNFGINQRATFRWVAAPNGELISTASANNGLYMRCVSRTAAFDTRSMLHWYE